MTINRRKEMKIHKVILDIKLLQANCTEVETMFIYHALDGALKKIGWRFAEMLQESKEKSHA